MADIVAETLDADTARALAVDAIAQGGCIDCRFVKLKEWAPQIVWDALRAELEI